MNKKKKLSTKKILFMAAMMAPAIIGFLVFYVYVNFNSIIMAFQVVDAKGIIHYNFDNFKYFFNQIKVSDSVFNEAIRNTLIFFLLGYVQMLLSLVVGYFIYKRIKGYKFFRFVFYLPCIIMPSVIASLYYYITRSTGPIGELYSLMHSGARFPSLWTESSTANLMLISYSLFFGIGGSMILFLGSMNNISPEIFEAAKLDGVGWVREIFQIIIPLIWPTFSVMILQSVTGLTMASGAVFLFTKGKYGTYTLSYWLYEQLLRGTNLERSSAIGWVCTLITFPLAILTKHFLDKAEEKIGA